MCVVFFLMIFFFFFYRITQTKNLYIFNSYLHNTKNTLDKKSVSLQGSMNELYCRVCDQYFSSLHNKKEHMFGRQHLQNITGEIQKDMQLQAEQESQDLVESSLVSSHLGNESSQSGDGICDSQHDITEKTSPVDVQGFIHGFLQENLGTFLSFKFP